MMMPIPATTKSLGQAFFDTGFETASWDPEEGGTSATATNPASLPAPLTHPFHPEADAPKNRYGTPLKDVKGFADGVPHGGKFTTRTVVGTMVQDLELRVFLDNEDFLAANPQFRGVVLSYDRDYLDMCFIAGAWRWLMGQVAKYAPESLATTATGPKAPAGLGGPIQTLPPGAPIGGLGAGPGDGGLISSSSIYQPPHPFLRTPISPFPSPFLTSSATSVPVSIPPLPLDLPTATAALLKSLNDYLSLEVSANLSPEVVAILRPIALSLETGAKIDVKAIGTEILIRYLTSGAGV